jgi:predicted amidophosphoribosyltransferase
MTEDTEKKCRKCGQRLRLPGNIGGMLMACPSCGEQFHSDFKLSCATRKTPLEKLAMIFGLPDAIMQRIRRCFFP